jgi:hypothetical protein
LIFSTIEGSEADEKEGETRMRKKTVTRTTDRDRDVAMDAH